MGYLVAWVERETPTSNENPIDTDHYQIFCSGDSDKKDAKEKYDELCKKMEEQDDSQNGIYTVQLTKIMESTEPQHLD
jgi:hypothetical protein